MIVLCCLDVLSWCPFAFNAAGGAFLLSQQASHQAVLSGPGHASCVLLRLSTVAAIFALPLPSALLCLNLLVHTHLTLHIVTFADYQ